MSKGNFSWVERLSVGIIVLTSWMYIDIIPDKESHRAKGGFTLRLFIGGLKPSRNHVRWARKKGGRYNVCYISGLDSDRYTHCCPCEFDLSDSQGKKEIAATIRSSDG